MTILVLLVPVLLGFALMRAVWPNGWRVCRHDVFRASLGAGFGLGLCSCLFFLALSLGLPGAALPVEIALLAAVAAFYARTRAGDDCRFCATQPEAPRVPWLLPGAAVLAVAGALATFVLFCVMAPLGESDAWSIWNLRAKFLALGGKNWTDAFSSVIGWSHPGYPLLIPASVGQAWHTIGETSFLAPIFVAGLFTFATAGLLYSSMEIRRGRPQALLALLALLGASSFARNGAALYADIPVGFFLLAAAALIGMEERFPAAAALAGLSAGLAAWTKNEGLLFAAGALVAQILFVRPRHLPLRRFLGGLLPGAAVLLFFKLRYAGANDLVASIQFGRLGDFGRCWTIGYQFAHQILFFGGYIASPVLVLGAYAWLLGIKPDEKARPQNRALLFLPLWMLAGDFSVYLLAPSALDWQLDTSLESVLLQLWPLAVLAVFSYVAVPRTVKVFPKPEPKAPKAARRASTAKLRTG
jgi:hypothetical protein